jgi:hypothetical protein
MVKPYTEKLLPRRPNERKDKLDPNETKSNKDRELPSVLIPYTLSDDPQRSIDRMDKLEPRRNASKTDKLLPNLANP